MKQAPAFGAIPSTKDLEKKKQEEEELADNADAILVKLCSKDARERLNFTESEEPAVADQVKDQLMETRAYWMLNGPVSDDKMKGMIDAIHAAKASSSSKGDMAEKILDSRGLVLDRRRLAEDSDDSDVSLSGL